MEQSDYGEDFQSHLLEQYKICVEMADRVSVKRGQANTFYISLLSALLALLSLIIDNKLVSGSSDVLLLFTSILGLTLCFTWYINIQSYRQLNSLKFKVISEMEQYLPFPCYSREWATLKERQREGEKQYIRLTAIERFVPLIFAVPYFGLLLYALFVFVGILG
ncbi:MAG: hypothetical protein HC840_20585 [Leptolyngbyaceae cyanobacterium RM2_2_4]|nr:hypothetical protein [Leptolyngbyaceae cyanobacterium SM1_4_3]NJO51437.1 hypothetical protein [Leptolyngbyaceae cyanobacterium RM2_2_4]